MANDHLVISCDSHIVEVPEIFNGLNERFGDEAPGIVHDAERAHMGCSKHGDDGSWTSNEGTKKTETNE